MRRYERCNYCGVVMTWVSMLPRRAQRQRDETIDHIWPISRGGTNHAFNRIKCCRRCNSDKDNLTLAEWLTKLQVTLDPREPFVRKVLKENQWTLLTQFTQPLGSSESRSEATATVPSCES